MTLLHSTLAFAAIYLTRSFVASATIGNSPSVQLDDAQFIGTSNQGVIRFLGIPYALPPVGDLRFEPPVRNQPYTGVRNATSFGTACGQIQSNNNGVKSPVSIGEDCLTLNVFAPSNITVDSKLPVIVWIYGGAFTGGSTEGYDASKIITRSVTLDSPVIYVSMNYRLNGFGFLPGKEVKAAGAGNLGLRDQRQALRWIQDYISAFGGDPSKVTIWGESAGAASVGSQMIAEDSTSDKLFRGAFMQSGSPIATGDITNGQPLYDKIVSDIGCTDTEDTFKCLKETSFEVLSKAFNAIPGLNSYSSLNRAWTPRADGAFIRAAAQHLVLEGHIANVPFVTGDCDDEGTSFSQGSLNVTTNEQVRDYLHSNYFPPASSDEIDEILAAYSDDITQGSPFDTGTANALTPQYKRIAAFTGDFGYQAPRRFMLNQLSDKQDTWAFLSKRNKSTPNTGSYHASDVPFIYGGGELTDGLIRFATELNPGSSWSKYNTSTRPILTFYDSYPSNTTSDTYRQEGMDVLTKLSLKYPL